MSTAVLKTQTACSHEVTSPPCEHNRWSDLRTRKSIKMLLCNICLAKWKVCACRCARNNCCAWAKRGVCSMGENCPKLHVAHSRPQTGCGAAGPCVDAPTELSIALPAHSPPEVHQREPSASTPGDDDDVPKGATIQVILPRTPQTGPSTTPRSAELPSPCATRSSVSLRLVEPWAPPACVSACGEYFEELDGYEPEGVAMTEEQLDAFLRRCCLA